LVTLDAAGQMISTAERVVGWTDQLDSDRVAAWGDLVSSQFDAR
jgi:hypothetical protein